MGTATLQSLNSLLPNLFSANRGEKGESSGLGPLVRSLASQGAAKQEVGFEKNRQQDLDSAYSATVYRAQVQELTLAARFQQIAAQNAETNAESETASETQAQQLSFDFYASSRYEELIQFNQRSQAVADNLEGSQKTTFMEASQAVAARFEFSMSISGSSLAGFSDAAEGLQDNSNLMDQFLGLTQQFLDAADGMFNDFFSLFGGLSTDDTQNTFSAMIQQFLQQLADSGLFGGSTDASGSANFSIQMEFSFEMSAQISVQQGQVQQSDPIMFDLDGDGFELSNYQDGADFDILGNGTNVQTAFVNGGDAFLAIDRNGNGQIDSGKELFGDQNGAVNGYEELRKMDTNRDGVINRQDADFDKLMLFKDNGNGKSEAGELISLADAGIEEISLGYRNVDQQTSGGNRLAQVASFRRTDGTYGKAADAILNYTA